VTIFQRGIVRKYSPSLCQILDSTPQQNETTVLLVSHKSKKHPNAVFWFKYLHPKNIKQSSHALVPAKKKKQTQQLTAEIVTSFL